MGAILDFFKALKLGNELSDPATWKNRAVLTTVIGGLLYIIVPYLPASIAPTPEVTDLITDAIISIVAVVNSYLMIATSKKVGL